MLYVNDSPLIEISDAKQPFVVFGKAFMPRNIIVLDEMSPGQHETKVIPCFLTSTGEIHNTFPFSELYNQMFGITVNVSNGCFPIYLETFAVVKNFIKNQLLDQLNLNLDDYEEFTGKRVYLGFV